MKKLLLLLMVLLLCFCGFCQSSAGNAAIDINYVGYFNNLYYISIANKQSCEAEVRVNWSDGDTSFSLAANSTVYLYLPAAFDANSTVRAKTNHTCVNTSAGWISVSPVATILSIQQDNRIKPTPKAKPSELTDIVVCELSGAVVTRSKAVNAGQIIRSLPSGAYFIVEGNKVRKIFKL
jgi:hypothetical protein